MVAQDAGEGAQEGSRLNTLLETEGVSGRSSISVVD